MENPDPSKIKLCQLSRDSETGGQHRVQAGPSGTAVAAVASIASSNRLAVSRMISSRLTIRESQPSAAADAITSSN
jgi:hypothetical protein